MEVRSNRRRKNTATANIGSENIRLIIKRRSAKNKGLNENKENYPTRATHASCIVSNLVRSIISDPRLWTLGSIPGLRLLGLLCVHMALSLRDPGNTLPSKLCLWIGTFCSVFTRLIVIHSSHLFSSFKSEIFGETFPSHCHSKIPVTPCLAVKWKAGWAERAGE